MPPGGARRDKKGKLLTVPKGLGKPTVKRQFVIFKSQDDHMDENGLNKSKFVRDALADKIEQESTDR